MCAASTDRVADQPEQRTSSRNWPSQTGSYRHLPWLGFTGPEEVWYCAESVERANRVINYWGSQEPKEYNSISLDPDMPEGMIWRFKDNRFVYLWPTDNGHEEWEKTWHKKEDGYILSPAGTNLTRPVKLQQVPTLVLPTSPERTTNKNRTKTSEKSRMASRTKSRTSPAVSTTRTTRSVTKHARDKAEEREP